MAEYNPAELKPLQYARSLEVDNLRAPARFMTDLIAEQRRRGPADCDGGRRR
jgi:hypothetical protein